MTVSDILLLKRLKLANLYKKKTVYVLSRMQIVTLDRTSNNEWSNMIGWLGIP